MQLSSFQNSIIQYLASLFFYGFLDQLGTSPARHSCSRGIFSFVCTLVSQLLFFVAAPYCNVYFPPTLFVNSASWNWPERHSISYTGQCLNDFFSCHVYVFIVLLIICDSLLCHKLTHVFSFSSWLTYIHVYIHRQVFSEQIFELLIL